MRRLVPPRRLAALAVALLAACGTRDPEPFVLNEDQCGYCRMTISDSRFGGEAVLPSGRVRKFDSVECLLAWTRATPEKDRGELYVIDTQHPGTFITAWHASFLTGASMRGPMGGSVLGFVSGAKAEEQRTMLGGRVVTWAQLLEDTVATGLRR